MTRKERRRRRARARMIRLVVVAATLATMAMCASFALGKERPGMAAEAQVNEPEAVQSTPVLLVNTESKADRRKMRKDHLLGMQTPQIWMHLRSNREKEKARREGGRKEMILSGHEIKKQRMTGKIKIENFNERQLGPNSYNLRLGSDLLVYRSEVLDAKQDNDVERLHIPPEGILLTPGRLYLGETMEYTETEDLVPMVEGRSSVGRLGINIHATAGFGDVGFHGRWTLELSCVQPVKIYAGMEICQIYYHTIQGEIEKTYAGKYQGSEGVKSSRLWQDFGGKR